MKHSGDQEDEPLRGELDRTPAISTASPSTELPLLSARLTEYKKAALKCKRENNLPQARALLVVSKKIQEQVDRLHSGLELSPGFEIPSPPEEFLLVSFIASEVPKESPAKPTPPTLKSKSSATARIPSPALKSPAPVATALPPAPIFNVPVAERPSFSHLISTLKAQVDACTGIAAYHLKADQKSKALEFHKLKKKMLLDLESLSALSSVPGSVPPTIAYRSVEFESELLHQDLNMTEMEISFRTVHDLTSVATEFTDILVGFNFDGYQDVGTGGKGETPLNKAIGNLGISFHFPFCIITHFH